MASVLNQLCKVLESLGESSQFSTAGSLTPVLPGLEVEGTGHVGIPIAPGDAQRLIAQASQAPYGRGEETLVDTSVRRVWQLEPRQPHADGARSDRRRRPGRALRPRQPA